MFGVAVGGVVEQGPDGGEAGVAGPDADASFVLEVVEEVADERRVDVVEGEAARRLAGAGLGVAENLAPRVPVGGDGVRAGLLLGSETVGEERLEQRSDRAHRRSSCIASSRSAMSSTSSGTADRYQYVVAGSM